MTPKNPDRFERMVAAITNSDVDVGYDAICFPVDVVKLLRREYRWMAKMIKTMEKPPGEVADVLSRRGILDQLTRRAT